MNEEPYSFRLPLYLKVKKLSRVKDERQKVVEEELEMMLEGGGEAKDCRRRRVEEIGLNGMGEEERKERENLPFFDFTFTSSYKSIFQNSINVSSPLSKPTQQPLFF